jgi:hypothetical protein
LLCDAADGTFQHLTLVRPHEGERSRTGGRPAPRTVAGRPAEPRTSAFRMAIISSLWS